MHGGILIYHTISAHAEPLPAGIATDPEQFARQIEMLRRSRVRIVPLAEIAEHFREHESLPRGAAAITFDDGYADNFTAAAPVLRAFDVPATFFVASDLIDLHWASPNGPIHAIGREHIRKLAAEPLFDFGSHGASHNPMTELNGPTLRDELLRSAERIESFCGKPVEMIAYPFGAFSERVCNAAAVCGYKFGFAVHNHRPTPMSIPRAPVHTRDSVPRVAFKLSRLYRPMHRLLRRGASADSADRARGRRLRR